jgi:hypothetical protein
VNRDPSEDDDNLLLFCGNNGLLYIDTRGLWRDVNPKGEGRPYIKCSCDGCKMKPANTYIGPLVPEKCVIEHEESHIADLPKGAGCKLEADGTCTNGGQTPEDKDYGGKEAMFKSECKAYKVGASCCARLVGIGVADDPKKPKKKIYSKAVARCAELCKISKRHKYPRKSL